MHRIALLVVSILVSSCSLVTVSGATTDTHFVNIGPVILKTEDPPRSIITSTLGIGVTSVEGTHNLGYLNQEVVLIPGTADCALILVVQNHQELENAKKVLGDALAHACTNDKVGTR